MTPRDIIKATMNKKPMSEQERRGILHALDVGETWGYGNLIAWLAAEWATMLRCKHGFSKKAANAAVSGMTPYSIPKEYFNNGDHSHNRGRDHDAGDDEMA